MMQRNKPSKRKVPFKVNDKFDRYLRKFNKIESLPLSYEDLLRYESSIALINAEGDDTYWQTVFFAHHEVADIHRSLTIIYSILKADGDTEIIDHLDVDRVDFCTFGNSQPFRVRIINKINDNYDHFYVKRADASRIYGLELENLLSPNTMLYRVDGATLIEAHVAGIPGDEFMEKNLDDIEFNQIRIAKEFIKFNERCFVRLLGDMRSYNFIVDITPDIEGSQFRMRAIDFDQQSYEGRKSFYLPQYFKENNPIIFLGMKHMGPNTVRQYQLEERSLIGRRIKADKKRVNEFLKVMVKDRISFPDKVDQLKEELSYHHKSERFDKCETMGDIVLANLDLLLDKEFNQSIISW